MPRSTLLNAYNSLVQSHFDYYSQVWGICGKPLSNKLQKLQNRAAHAITSLDFDVDVDSLFHKLSWKDLKSSNLERLNGFQVFLWSGSRISRV